MMVLVSHYTFCSTFSLPKESWLYWFDGKLGVRCFFTISGFLITWLLICEKAKTSTVSLKNFYVRRSLRILPVYVSILLVLWIMHLCQHPYQGALIWIGLLTFTRNFLGVESTGGIVSGHLWSLSIEEQFYFLWPGIFTLLIDSKLSKRCLYGLLGLVLVASPLCRTLSLLGEYPAKLRFSLFGEFSTFMYLDCLAYGCFAAFVLFYKRDEIENFFKKWGILVSMVSGLFILIPYVVKLGNAFQAVGFSILILYSVVNPASYLYKILNLSWVSRIGMLSYSLYVWQQISWNLFDLGRFWVFSILPIFGIAWISYAFIERPFLKIRNRFRAV